MISRMKECSDRCGQYRHVRDQLDQLGYGVDTHTLAIFCPTCPDGLRETLVQLECILLPVEGCLLDNFDIKRGDQWNAIDCALQSERIDEIVLCGHTPIRGQGPREGLSVRAETNPFDRLLEGARRHQRRLAATRQHVIVQLDRLKRHSTVAAAIAAGSLEVHGLIYLSESQVMQRYCSETEQYIPVG